MDAGAVIGKMKIEPAVIFFMENTTSSQMADKNDLIDSLSFFFSKSSKWIASGQNAGNS